jgi:solute carrier family 25 protein 39/40
MATFRHHVSVEDVTPQQQMMASCSGALLGKRQFKVDAEKEVTLSFRRAVSLFMTPLDVVKIRLQSQDMLRSKCFLYSNGITDHLCPRVNGDPPLIAPHTAQDICNCKWYNRPKYFNGTMDAFVKISRYSRSSRSYRKVCDDVTNCILEQRAFRPFGVV